jgi:hypothetical protein
MSQASSWVSQRGKDNDDIVATLMRRVQGRPSF